MLKSLCKDCIVCYQSPFYEIKAIGGASVLMECEDCCEFKDTAGYEVKEK